jgi:hypothetical protein
MVSSQSANHVENTRKRPKTKKMYCPIDEEHISNPSKEVKEVYLNKQGKRTDTQNLVTCHYEANRRLNPGFEMLRKKNH